MAISRKRQRIGYLVGASVAVLEIGLLMSPNLDAAHAKGPMNVGHETLTCDECHQSARGTLRQQIQANVAYALGTRTLAVDFGFAPVTSRECSSCHDRPKDRHPVSRFLEPRFSEARRETQAHRCVGCHAEHTGVRVSSGSEFCSHCHDDLRNEGDDLHKEVAGQDQWQSCLRCHDFHGNHTNKVPETLDTAYPESIVKQYLVDGESPYGAPRVTAVQRSTP